MIIVEPSVELLGYTVTTDRSVEGPSEGARLIERAGRVCWKSEPSISPTSATTFCDRVITQFGHESIAEHASATILFITDRIVSHQMVRARIGAYSQESTHFLNYSKGKFGRQISVCKPWILRNENGIEELAQSYWKWFRSCEAGESAYFDLIENEGWPHYEARYVLPMGLKTEVVATYNFRMWNHVLTQRTEKNSAGGLKNTPEIHDLMTKASLVLSKLCPEVFGKWAQ
jgi:thymidylate synthase (FAD)